MRSELRGADVATMTPRLTSPVIFDGRNPYTPATKQAPGVTYLSIGR